MDLEEVGAGLRTGLFRLMLHEVAQHPGNGSSSCGRPYFLLPIEAGASSISAL